MSTTSSSNSSSNVEDANFECSICLEICTEAVESICCGALHCQWCTVGIEACPACREVPFNTVASKFTRKLIGRLKVSCDRCGASVQRDSTSEHMQVCEMRELKCAARGCIFTGVKHELLEHVVLSHEEDILTIVQGLDKRHVFELDQPEQTVSGATNHFVQAISPEYKPMKKDIHDAMAMYYCGRPLPFLCVCRIHYVIHKALKTSGALYPSL